jgi:hypothetical protein
MSLKIVSVIYNGKDPYRGEFNGKPFEIWEATVSAEVDGKHEDKITVKSGKQDVIKGLKEGQEFDFEKKDNKGFVSYKIKPLGGSTGGFQARGGFGGGRPPENPAEKRAGVSMSYAVSLVNGGSADMSKLYTLADDIYEWMCAKVAKG